ncbi:hypothetical protein GGS20DRAFT_552043 [Poronia punctata]|nr:hypothetical protein GGS20DRAFT_552043 [Poronia punctata]
MIRNAVPRPSPGPNWKLPRHVRSFVATSTPPTSYDSTLGNLKIGKHTRVIFQGFTGKQATANAKESIEWGTNIVGGVRPGFEGEHLGRPVLPTVRKAMEVLKPDATGIYVAAHQATAAIEEAIEAEVPLIVAVAEHIPLHDMLRIHAMLKSQSKSRLVGANSPGLISAVGKCRIGFQPLPCFEPGRVGIVARSGTLSYETAASTLRSGLGQSMCIGVGGDILPGTTLKDGLQILTEDPDTEAIALVGEIGGEAELEAAYWINQYRARTDKPKPIAALVAGINAPPSRIMGHAGAFTNFAEPGPQEKVKALEEAGCAIVNHPSRFGPVLSGMLNGSFSSVRRGNGGAAPSPTAVPIRGFHTAVRSTSRRRPVFTPRSGVQKRKIHLDRSASFELLRQREIPVINSIDTPVSDKTRLLCITINRSAKTPCVLVAGPADYEPKRFNFDYASGTGQLDIAAIASEFDFGRDPDLVIRPLRKLIDGLITLFKEKEGYLFETVPAVEVSPTGEISLGIASARFGFDDAAHRSCRRQEDIQPLRDTSGYDPAELDAERDGIVYIKLEGGSANNIGTLVNGAGLAMNTVDALRDAGGRAANFLDTGGKATSETVKKSFELILTDPRVKCVFVNIFGGLTLGDMIARGIVLAFRDLHMKVPVVVRIRGTNEKEGQKIIAESGLPLFAFDDFDEAAAKAIELANANSS